MTGGAGYPPVYLDHHATTPVDPRVAQVVLRAMTEAFGNPNSAQHSFGQAAAALVVDAARKVAELLGAEPEDVRFTSGASEALRLALAYAQDRAGAPQLRIAASRIEHPALLEALVAGEHDGRFCVGWIEPESSGRVPLSAVEAATDGGVDLVCLMAANNETGVLQPVRGAAELVHRAGAMILVDATQAAGRTSLDQQVDDFDFLVVSAHKMYGPKGVGALVGQGLGEAAAPSSLNVHNATPNVPGISGFGEAAHLCRLEMTQDERRIAGLRDRLQMLLCQELPGLVVNGDVTHRLAGSLHISAPGASNDMVVANLRDLVALSTGAACVSGVDAPSHVLQAMRLEPWRQDTALRMGLGRFTTQEEVDRAAKALIAAVQRVRSELQPAV